jgi:hypothetical protein
MKHLVAPAISVFGSTAGSVYGCHVAGMPPRDLLIAGLVAFSVSFAVTSAAVAVRMGRLPRTTFRPVFPRKF